jgi:Tfp pilus assembly protein PilF
MVDFAAATGTIATIAALFIAWRVFRVNKPTSVECVDAAPRDETCATPVKPDQTPAERCVAQGTLLLRARGNEEAAKQQFEDALVLDAECASAHVALGQLDQRRGDSKAAAARYKAAILANPRDPLASHLLCALERNEESRAMLELASREAQQLRDAGALDAADAPAWFVEALRLREEQEELDAR